MKTKIAEILNEFRKTISSKRKHELRQILAEHYFVSGDFEESLQYFQSYLLECEEANDKQNQMVTHRRIGDCFLQMRSLDNALTHYQRYLKLAVSLNNRIEEQRAYHTIGESYFEKCDEEDVLTKKKKLLKLSDLSYIKSYRIWESLAGKIDEKELKEMLASNLLNRGLIDMERENYDLASRKLITSYVEAKKCASEIQLTCLLMLATLKMKNENFKDAIFFLKEAKKLVLSDEDEKKLKDKTFEVLLTDNRFKKAVKLMRNAAKHKKDDREYYMEKTKTALKMHKIQHQLSTTLEKENKTKLFEKLGDMYANESIFRKALDCYQEMLTCARETKSHEEMATAHACLAVTNGDLGRYETALFHYEKEAELRSNTGAYNPEELVRTYLNIARFSFCLERCDEALSAARKAKDLAATLQSAKLRVEALKEELNAIVALNGETSVEARSLRSAIEASPCDDEEADGDDEAKASEEDDFEIELDALSSDSSEESDGKDDEVVQIPGVALRKNKRNNTLKIKRNEKGETPLHRACIDGRLTAVRELVETRGHPLNVEDNAGWTPLHDACNCGNVEIVRFLVEHGADVAHTGCPRERNTPLLSAAEGGCLDICHYLIKEKKVNVWHKNAAGANVMDLIDDCRERSVLNGTFDTEAAKNYRDFVSMLRETIGESKYVEFLRSRRGKKPQKRETLNEITYDPLDKRFHRDIEADAVSDYMETLKMVGGSSTRLTLAEKKAPRSFEGRSDEEKGYVVGDDWLVPDEDELPSASHRNRPKRCSLIDSSRARREVSRSPSPLPNEPSISPKRKRVRKSAVPSFAPSSDDEVKRKKPTPARVSCPPLPVQTPVDNATEETCHSLSQWAALPVFEDAPVPLTQTGSDRGTITIVDNVPASNTGSTGELSGVSRSSHANLAALPRCVRLVFNEISILIPLRDRSLTVGWLLREFVNRSESLSNGVALPTLDQIVLRSEEGDFFSAETDRLADVLNVSASASVVNVSVVTKDEAGAKMFESKENACPVDKRPHLSIGGLKLINPSNAISLSGLSDQLISHLSLPENEISDNVFRHISLTIANWHHCLTHLDLSKNYITADTVNLLADLSPLPSKVAHVNLSGNNFGDDGIPAITRLLVRWPGIRHVDLSQCMLTETGVLKYQKEWTNAFATSKVESLNLSFNVLENKGIDFLLRSMQTSCRITALYIRGCIVYSEGASVMSYFLQYLSLVSEKSNVRFINILDIGSSRLTSSGIDVFDSIFNLENCEIEALKIDDNRDLIKSVNSASRFLSSVFKKRVKHVEMDAPSMKESEHFCETLYCLLLESEENRYNLSYLLLKRCTFSKLVFNTVMRANIANRKSLFFCERLRNGSVILKRQ